jgi:hypothetical protein
MSDLGPVIVGSTISTVPEIERYCQQRFRFRLDHIIRRLNTRMMDIRARWPDATADELFVAYDMCDSSLEDLIASLDEPSFQHVVRMELDRRAAGGSSRPAADQLPAVVEESDDDDDDDFVCSFESDLPMPRARSTRRKSAARRPPCTIPCPEEIRPEVWANWSAARKSSYTQAQDRPHAYFYRHLPPGETQRNGPWTPAERKLFVQRMQEMRGNADTFTGSWGTFSLAIPGRVGYQCSNFYRAMLHSGEMKDSRYFKGDDGKLHHTSRLHPAGTKEKKSKKGAKKGDRQGAQPLGIESLESLVLMSVSSGVSSASKLDVDREEEAQLGRYQTWELQNPLPEAVDLITGQLIRVPAMSPDGYVLDYKTWLDSLAENPVNPFTRMHLTKRQLVVLTIENIHEYVDRISHLELHKPSANGDDENDDDA